MAKNESGGSNGENGNTTGGTEHIVAHQVGLIEETTVGTKDSDKSAVVDIKLPSGANSIHPEVAERLREEYGVKYLYKFGVHVADERYIETKTDQ